MKKTNSILIFLLPCIVFFHCGKKSSDTGTLPPPPASFSLSSLTINNVTPQATNYNISADPSIRFRFSAPIDRSTVANSIALTLNSGGPVNYSVAYSNGDSAVVIKPSQPLSFLTKYRINLATTLKSSAGGNLVSGTTVEFLTTIDSTDKFTRVSETELLDLVQKQTFKYFWDFAHPASGLARERSNGDNNLVTSGGSGFGIMSIIVAVHRNFITRAEGLARMQTITSFLKNTAQKVHGAFPHWLNGQTGAIIPFSQKDNGADLVETSFLMQGLLTARQYFNRADAAETNLRNDINGLWNAVEWSWFRRNNENVLYWHYSENYQWEMNHAIRGWNECLITYVLAASSPTHNIPKIVYDEGWAQNGGMQNGASYYGYTLPLGPPQGGPLFFSHYSFLGIDPTGLTDQYANYQTQVVNHTMINHEYCKENPKNYFGYSDQCWGLTASDIPNGYTASSPTNDVGVIAPTAALSSFPYTPTESMKALEFFYYKLGDKLWTEYGFRDAFSLHEPWFAGSHLAIDQGPIIVMIENYRSGLLWDLFMSCPEVQTGMKALGFNSPHF